MGVEDDPGRCQGVQVGGGNLAGTVETDVVPTLKVRVHGKDAGDKACMCMIFKCPNFLTRSSTRMNTMLGLFLAVVDETSGGTRRHSRSNSIKPSIV